MVYCLLKEKTGNYAIYATGKRVDDMTGEIVFYKDEQEPELLKQADRFPVHVKDITRLYVKYKAEFSKGEFREKLAIEIG